MPKIIGAALALLTLLSGCQTSRQIETASIIETVSVGTENGEIVYTFFRLGDEEKPQPVKIPARSFEQACALAKDRYIPHLSLSKLELIVINKNLANKILRSDIDYISTQTRFSPIALVALCDKATEKKLLADKNSVRLIEQELFLSRENDSGLKIDYLSIFNAYSQSGKSFKAAYINSENEIKTEIIKINPENLKNN